jgi:hypothetical protein
MFEIDIVEDSVQGQRFSVHLPRIPVSGEFLVVGESEYRISEVHFCCSASGIHGSTWVRVSKTPPDVEDSLEDI